MKCVVICFFCAKRLQTLEIEILLSRSDLRRVKFIFFTAQGITELPLRLVSATYMLRS